VFRKAKYIFLLLRYFELHERKRYMDVLMKLANEIIRKQLKSNSLKNIFCTDGNQLHFNNNTKDSIEFFGQKWKKLSECDKEYIINALLKGFLESFYNVDQYISFKDKDYLEIKKIYISLFQDITNDYMSVQEIEERHYKRIRTFIKKTNRVVYKINHNANKNAKSFMCSEYSSKFQIRLLGINICTLKEPILDIGCGEQGNLVKYLRKNHLRAYGIDRLQENTGYFRSIDWLEFDYFQLKWGTIISNISFSNHFIHHFTQNDGIDILYAQTYMKILKSLDNGGKWIYAPSVPFIENLLPKDEFSVQRIQINESFSKTIVHKFLVL
jgi:hypothetical protein